MKIEDFKKGPRYEKRSCRANLRLYPSQMKFINDHGLSFQEIFDKALDELGHEIPSPEDIDKLEHMYGYMSPNSRGHGKGGKGNVPAQRARYRRKRR